MELRTKARMNRYALLTVALLLANCAGRKMSGNWKDRDIYIDGNQNEWRGLLAVPEGQRIALGAMNDADYLYLLVSTADRPTMGQMLRLGLVLTIDAPAVGGQALQVTYPTRRRPGNGTAPGGRGGSADRRPDWEQAVAGLAAAQPWFVLRGPGKEDITELPLWSEAGIRLGLGFSSADQLVWEIRLPLRTTPGNRYALDATPGQSLALKVATATPNRDRQGPYRGAGGGRAGGRRRPGGGGFAGAGGGQPGRGQIQPLNYKFTVQLAKPGQAVSMP